MRSFAFVLLRRFLSRSLSSSQLQSLQTPVSSALPQTLYHSLSPDCISAIEHLALHSFIHEPASTVRQAAAEAICTIAHYSQTKGQPWHALTAQLFLMTQDQNAMMRASAFKILAGTDMYTRGVQTEDILKALSGGLQDKESIEVGHLLLLHSMLIRAALHSQVRFYALRASGSYLLGIKNIGGQSSESLSLLPMMLDTLPPLPPSQFRRFISSLSFLALLNATVFRPHLHQLLEFLTPLMILSSTDSCSTPTESKPNSDIPLSDAAKQKDNERMGDRDEEQDMARGALEFMMTLTEADPDAVKNVDGWIATITRGCLEGMGILHDDNLHEWLAADVCRCLVHSLIA